MDQNQNYNGNGMVFGVLDHIPSGQTILNDSEDDYLSTFFDNPNMAQQADPYEHMFNLGGKSLSQGTFSATPAFGNTNLDASTSLDPSQPPYQPSHHMNNMTGQHQHPQQQSSFTGHAGFLADASLTQTQTMNNADMNAASSLFGFANKTNGTQLAGSWGNLVVGNSNLSADTNSSNYAGTTNSSGRAPPFPAHSHAWGGNGSGSGNGDTSHANSAQQAGDPGSRYFEHPNPFASPQATPSQQRQFPGVQFGTDNNFSNTHYQGPQYSKDKAGNLLNVPLADKARVPYGPHAMANQHTNPQAGGSWGAFRTPGLNRPSDDDEFSDSQARKRHKGHDNRDDEHEWDPRVGQHDRNGSQAIKVEQPDEEPSMPAATSSTIPPSSAKRRRTVDRQTSQLSKSPPAGRDGDSGEGSARKRGAKKRENLTEDQKRKNHIHSEKKRREIIQQGYAELNRLVPCLVGGKSQLSRSEALHEITQYLEVLGMGNARMMEMMDGVDESHPALQAVHADWVAATARIE